MVVHKKMKKRRFKMKAIYRKNSSRFVTLILLLTVVMVLTGCTSKIQPGDDEIENGEGNLAGTEPATVSETQTPEQGKDTNGNYPGQNNNNSVELIVAGETIFLNLTDITKTQLDALTSGQGVVFTCEQNDSGQTVILGFDVVTQTDETNYTQGRYVGQIDNNSIEVVVDGETIFLRLTDTTKTQLDALTTGQEVVFSCVKNDEGQTVLVGFDVVEQAEETIHAQGRYVGQIDNNSIEVMVNSEPVAFRLTSITKLQLSVLTEGQEIMFTYEKSNAGQNVILSFDGIAQPDETVHAQGRYVGQIDNNSIEVIMDDTAVAFRLLETVKNQVANLIEGQDVGFVYGENDAGHNVIISFDGVDQTVTATFGGRIDPHTIEVAINGYSFAFQLDDDILPQVDTLNIGDEIKISFIVNEHGQNMAEKIEKQ